MTMKIEASPSMHRIAFFMLLVLPYMLNVSTFFKDMQATTAGE